MRYNVLVVWAIVSFSCFFGLSYQENCMWDGSCADERYNIDFCGNGYCEVFETKDTCIEDCGSMLDLIVEKVMSTGRGGEESGPFGGLQGSGIRLMLCFIVLIVVIVILGIILIAAYHRVVGSIERANVS